MVFNGDWQPLVQRIGTKLFGATKLAASLAGPTRAGRLADKSKRAGHAEVESQPIASIELRHQVLAVTPDFNESCAAHPPRQTPKRKLAENPRIAHGNACDRLSQRIPCGNALDAFESGSSGLEAPASAAQLMAAPNEACLYPREPQALAAVAGEVDREPSCQFRHS